MSDHYLDPLLKPGSIALIGASNREGSPGNTLAGLVISSSYSGSVYLVNPGHKEIQGRKCYPDLAALPETVDHAVLAISNERLELALVEAIEHGVKAVTLYSSCVLENDSDPPLKDRLVTLAKQAGLAVCGGNGMGFYAVRHGLYAGIFPKPGDVQLGSIAFIVQSGSAFSALVHNGSRLGFNLCVSSGNEMVTTTSDYVDWALAQAETRVIALFIETVRDPAGFVEALARARDRRIPVVALKVGKSVQGAKMAATHSGAIAGNHAAYEAVFRKFGVIEVSSLDEMAATLMLFQVEKRPGPGKLAAFFESGGFMEMVADICAELNLEFAEIGDDTRKVLKANLEPGLKPDNPLNGWGSNDDFENRFYHCISAIMKDPAVATGIFFSNFRDDYYLTEAFIRVMLRVNAESDKPVAMANCYSDIQHPRHCEQTRGANLPFLDGVREALLGVKHSLEHRDRGMLSADQPPPAGDETLADRWRGRLRNDRGETLGEAQALSLLHDFGIRTPQFEAVAGEQAAVSAANRIGYPVVLKTSQSEIHHKSDLGGVVVGIKNDLELRAHYRDFARRLGPGAIVCEQVDAGTEVGLGMINDPQFGPLVMVSAGGVLMELLAERAVGLAPLNHREAKALIACLKLDTLIGGIRGRHPEDRAALVDCIVKFSWIAVQLQDWIQEMDVNPLIVNSGGAIAADALFVRRKLNDQRKV